MNCVRWVRAMSLSFLMMASITVHAHGFHGAGEPADLAEVLEELSADGIEFQLPGRESNYQPYIEMRGKRYPLNSVVRQSVSQLFDKWAATGENGGLCDISPSQRQVAMKLRDRFTRQYAIILKNKFVARAQKARQAMTRENAVQMSADFGNRMIDVMADASDTLPVDGVLTFAGFTALEMVENMLPAMPHFLCTLNLAVTVGVTRQMGFSMSALFDRTMVKASLKDRLKAIWLNHRFKAEYWWASRKVYTQSAPKEDGADEFITASAYREMAASGSVAEQLVASTPLWATGYRSFRKTKFEESICTDPSCMPGQVAGLVRNLDALFAPPVREMTDDEIIAQIEADRKNRSVPRLAPVGLPSFELAGFDGVVTAIREETQAAPPEDAFEATERFDLVKIFDLAFDDIVNPQVDRTLRAITTADLVAYMYSQVATAREVLRPIRKKDFEGWTIARLALREQKAFIKKTQRLLEKFVEFAGSSPYASDPRLKESLLEVVRESAAVYRALPELAEKWPQTKFSLRRKEVPSDNMAWALRDRLKVANQKLKEISRGDFEGKTREKSFMCKLNIFGFGS